MASKGCLDQPSPCSRDDHTIEIQRGRSSKVQRACQHTHPCGRDAWKADRDGSLVRPTMRCAAAKTPKITMHRNETKQTWPVWARFTRLSR
jgi:hypothetical protein